MPRPTLKNTLDLSAADNKRRVQGFAGTCVGMYRVTFEPAGNTRSSRQNAAWFGMIVQPLYEFLREQDVDVNNAEDVHYMLAEHFLKEPIISRRTGEIVGHRIKRTSKLTAAEFAELFERARIWVENKFGMVVPDPDPIDRQPTTFPDRGFFSQN